MAKKLLVDGANPSDITVALVDGSRLIDFERISTSRQHETDAIFLGRITAIRPDIRGCFVNIGDERDAFLPLIEISETETPADGDADKGASDDDADTEALVKSVASGELKPKHKVGDVIAVQVSGPAREGKGAKVSTKFRIPCYWIVHTPGQTGWRVSRRHQGDASGEWYQNFRKGMANEPDFPGGGIIRTNASHVNYEYVVAEAKHAGQMYRELLAEAERAGPVPRLIFRPSLHRVLQNLVTSHIVKVIVEGQQVFEDVKDWCAAYQGDGSKTPDVEEYDPGGKDPLFNRFGFVKRQMMDMMKRTVALPSGGSIVIDKTEACWTIDVNSSSSSSSAKTGDRYFAVNMEAAVEIAQQVRLRDLSGLIVIDFIDMDDPKQRRAIEAKMMSYASNSSSAWQVLTIDELGLMRMSRQRRARSVAESAGVQCSLCDGSGWVPSDVHMTTQIGLEIRELVAVTPAKLVRLRVSVELALGLESSLKEQRMVLQTFAGCSVELVRDNTLTGLRDYNIEIEPLLEGETAPLRDTMLEVIHKEPVSNRVNSDNVVTMKSVSSSVAKDVERIGKHAQERRAQRPVEKAGPSVLASVWAWISSLWSPAKPELQKRRRGPGRRRGQQDRNQRGGNARGQSAQRTGRTSRNGRRNGPKDVDQRASTEATNKRRPSTNRRPRRVPRGPRAADGAPRRASSE